MLPPREVLNRLLDRRDLSEEEAAALLESLTAPDLLPALAGALLIALCAKGVTAQEVRGFAGAMRSLARKPAFAQGADAIDIVGTGGDASGSFNLSTGAAFLAAACGLPVVKHGNRSITSRSGSADLIESLGFTLPLDEQQAAKCFAATGFTFLFAPYYHPAMSNLAPIRKALGVRTVFNLLGPLTNPAAPRFQLDRRVRRGRGRAHRRDPGRDADRARVGGARRRRLGRGDADRAVPGVRRRRGTVGREVLDPEDFGLPRCLPLDLKGGDAAANLAALRRRFSTAATAGRIARR